MKKKFAYILMGQHYNPNTDKSCFETEEMTTYIQTVRNIEEALEFVSVFEKEGVLAIELCGGFGKENANKIIDITKNKIAIGYAIHESKQDALFDAFFSN